MRLRLSILCTLVALTFLGAACTSTIVPAPVVAQQASYDGGAANSGVLQLDTTGAIITAHARDRYNALIALYGREFAPALVADAGITPLPDGTFRITAQALTNFALMNAWRKTGKVPSK